MKFQCERVGNEVGFARSLHIHSIQSEAAVDAIKALSHACARLLWARRCHIRWNTIEGNAKGGGNSASSPPASDESATRLITVFHAVNDGLVTTTWHMEDWFGLFLQLGQFPPQT